MAGLELLSDEGYRVDGRRAGELRKVRARMGVFAKADGSAYIEQGNTKALAVVYGPHEVRAGPASEPAAGRRCPPGGAQWFNSSARGTPDRRGAVCGSKAAFLPAAAGPVQGSLPSLLVRPLS
uniref:Exoribonuclease phosphorolytic domain-containing protein n=1 Tax=Gopherus agassizii TaxID=38772 RepID=A0A452HAP0_9SAUR